MGNLRSTQGIRSRQRLSQFPMTPDYVPAEYLGTREYSSLLYPAHTDTPYLLLCMYLLHPFFASPLDFPALSLHKYLSSKLFSSSSSSSSPLPIPHISSTASLVCTVGLITTPPCSNIHSLLKHTLAAAQLHQHAFHISRRPRGFRLGRFSCGSPGLQLRSRQH